MAATPYQIRAVGDSAVRNLIINGNMDFWQRGTSLTTSASTAQYLADRFLFFRVSANSAPVISQSTDVPTQAQSGWQSRYSYLVTLGSSANSSPASTDQAYIAYKMEGQDYQQLHNRKCRLQFWVKSSVPGVYSLCLQNSAVNRVYVTTYTISSASTWQKVTLDVPLDTTGTWNFDNTSGLEIHWSLVAGSNFTTSTLNSWQGASTNAASTANTTFWTTANATFQLAQVSLYPGNFDSGLSIPFQRCGRSIGHELQLCQRYYEKSYPVDVAPGTASTGSNTGVLIVYPFDTTVLTRGFLAGGNSTFKTTKRANPTMLFWSDDGTSGAVSPYNSSGTHISISSTFFITTGPANPYITLSSALTSGTTYDVNWTADSEL